MLLLPTSCCTNLVGILASHEELLCKGVVVQSLLLVDICLRLVGGSTLVGMLVMLLLLLVANIPHVELWLLDLLLHARLLLVVASIAHTVLDQVMLDLTMSLLLGLMLDLLLGGRLHLLLFDPMIELGILLDLLLGGMMVGLVLLPMLLLVDADDGLGCRASA